MRIFLAWLAAGLLGACAAPDRVADGAFRGDLLRPADIDAARLAQARAAGSDTIVLDLHDSPPDATATAAAAAVRAAGLRLGYWLEVGRSPALGEQHPQWLASLQGHPEWRRRFPQCPEPAPGQVIKTWPWLPVAYAEAFAAHRARIAAQLAAMPAADLLFLNDLQGPPAACGCGNVLCRWATDYTLHGKTPLRTATPLGHDAGARFVAEVQRLAPASEVIPVWVTECEEADTVSDGACCGVGCYKGECWRQFDRQWAALQDVAPRIALLLPYESFGRDLPRYGAKAGWVRFAIDHLRARPVAPPRTPIAPRALVAVLQGWGGAAPASVQCAQAAAAGVSHTLIAHHPIDQSWEPRLVQVSATSDAKR